ncbi:hypothetical protein QTP88_020840 [Uroleucon formosanum]
MFNISLSKLSSSLRLLFLKRFACTFFGLAAAVCSGWQKLESLDVEGRASSLVVGLLFVSDSSIMFGLSTIESSVFIICFLSKNCIQSKYTYFFLFPPADPDFVFFNVALHLTYLVTGQRYSDLYFSYRLGTATIGGIIKEVCTNIWDLFHEECLSIPNTTEGWLKIAAGFENTANFPNCIGSIDGKHVRIICPEHSGSLFSNYKKYYSIVLLAMCDSDYRFTYIHVGACGTDSDSTIFKESTLFTKINNGEIMLPPPKPLPNTTEPLPYIIIGDSAFGISNKVLRPYARSNLTKKKKIFNYRISRARRYIESTFGIMSNKFNIFHRPMNTALPNTITIVKACCVLHNFIRERDGYRVEDTLTVEGFQELQLNVNNNIVRTGDMIRDKFANYFVSPDGSVSWQDASIF